MFKNEWVVYSKPLFGKPENVIAYLGRYTHKIAISNHRILKLDTQNRKVIFGLIDYRKGGEKITVTLSAKGFTCIRHYGFLSSSWKKDKLPLLQLQLIDKNLTHIEIFVSKKNRYIAVVRVVKKEY